MGPRNAAPKRRKTLPRHKQNLKPTLTLSEDRRIVDVRAGKSDARFRAKPRLSRAIDGKVAAGRLHFRGFRGTRQHSVPAVFDEGKNPPGRPFCLLLLMILLQYSLSLIFLFDIIKDFVKFRISISKNIFTLK